MSSPLARAAAMLARAAGKAQDSVWNVSQMIKAFKEVRGLVTEIYAGTTGGAEATALLGEVVAELEQAVAKATRVVIKLRRDQFTAMGDQHSADYWRDVIPQEGESG